MNGDRRSCARCGLGPPYVEFRPSKKGTCVLCLRAAERRYNGTRAGRKRARRYVESGRMAERKRHYFGTLLGKIARLVTIERWRVNHATSEKRKQSAQLRLELYLEQRERIWRQRRAAS